MKRKALSIPGKLIARLEAAGMKINDLTDLRDKLHLLVDSLSVSDRAI